MHITTLGKLGLPSVTWRSLSKIIHVRLVPSSVYINISMTGALAPALHEPILVLNTRLQRNILVCLQEWGWGIYRLFHASITCCSYTLKPTTRGSQESVWMSYADTSDGNQMLQRPLSLSAGALGKVGTVMPP